MPVYTKGDFVCDYEAIPAADGDARHRGKYRIVSVTARLVRRKGVSRGAAPDPLVGPMKDYLAGAPHLMQIGYDNGHLIGLEIGGIDEKYNIAPMIGWFNEVKYREIERRIRDDTSYQHMRVQVFYDAEHKALPIRFRVLAAKAAAKDAEPVFEQVKVLAMETPTPDPYPFDAGIRDAVAARLPSIKPRAEPYAFLDAIGVPGSQSDTSIYSELQRQYILTANALYSQAAGLGCFLRSDDPDDPIQVLNPRGGKDRPQVDHVVPKSRSGGNSFRNARVTSKYWNGKKGAKVDKETLDILKAAVDPRPSRRAKERRTHETSHIKGLRKTPY